MSTLKEQIQKRTIEAMKAKEDGKATLNTLRSIKSLITEAEKKTHRFCCPVVSDYRELRAHLEHQSKCPKKLSDGSDPPLSQSYLLCAWNLSKNCPREMYMSTRDGQSHYQKKSRKRNSRQSSKIQERYQRL